MHQQDDKVILENHVFPRHPALKLEVGLVDKFYYRWTPKMTEIKPYIQLETAFTMYVKHEASINLNLLCRWRALHVYVNMPFYIDVTQSSARCVNFPAMHIANMKQNRHTVYISLSL